MTTIKRLSHTLAFSLTAEFINKISPLLILAWVRRRLGLEAFGEAQFAISITDYFIPLVVLGFPTSTILQLRNPAKEKVREVLSSAIFCKILFFFIAAILLSWLFFGLPRYGAYGKFYWPIVAILFSSAIDCNPIFFATQKLLIFNLFMLVSKLISLALVFYFIWAPEDSVLYVSFIVGANILTSLSTLIYVLKNYGLTFPTKQATRRCLLLSLPFIVTTLLQSFERYDLFLVEWFGSAVAVGQYAPPYRLAQSLIPFATIISSVFLSEFLSITSREEQIKKLNFGIWSSTHFCFPVLFFSIFFGDIFLKILVGAVEPQQNALLLILVAASCLQIIGFLPGAQLLTLENRQKNLNIFLFISIISGISLSFVLRTFFDPSLSVATSFLFGKCLFIISCILLARKLLTNVFKIKNYSWRGAFLIFMMMTPLGFLTKTLFGLSSVFSQITAVLVLLIIYTSLFWFFEQERVRKILALSFNRKST